MLLIGARFLFVKLTQKTTYLFSYKMHLVFYIYRENFTYNP
jgi:hypothetical protein